MGNYEIPGNIKTIEEYENFKFEVISKFLDKEMSLGQIYNTMLEIEEYLYWNAKI